MKFEYKNEKRANIAIKHLMSRTKLNRVFNNYVSFDNIKDYIIENANVDRKWFDSDFYSIHNLIENIEDIIFIKIKNKDKYEILR